VPDFNRTEQAQSTMRSTFPLILAAALFRLLLVAPPATAEIIKSSQELMDNPRMIGYLQSDPFIRALHDLGVEQDRRLGLKECSGSYTVKPRLPFVLSPIDFPENRGNPVKGTWCTRYSFTRCGDTRIYNTIFVADPAGGFPRAVSYYPGDPIADPQLVYDAMTLAMISALSKSGVKDCKEVMVTDMRPGGFPDENGVWNEVWYFRVCGKDVEVFITFVPDREHGGTTFFIKSKCSRLMKSG
jgi:hypothetical protein